MSAIVGRSRRSKIVQQLKGPWRPRSGGESRVRGLCGRFRAESEGCPDSLRSATTGRWRICHKAACQALWVYASIQYFDVPLFTIF